MTHIVTYLLFLMLLMVFVLEVTHIICTLIQTVWTFDITFFLNVLLKYGTVCQPSQNISVPELALIVLFVVSTLAVLPHLVFKLQLTLKL